MNPSQIHCKTSAISQLKVRVNPVGFTLTFGVDRALAVQRSDSVQQALKETEFESIQQDVNQIMSKAIFSDCPNALEAS